MVEQKWKYCQLFWYWSEMKSGLLKDDPDFYKYSAAIGYYFSDGRYSSRNLADPSDYLKYNPVAKALGLLGGARWELVSIQHGQNNQITGGGTGALL